MTPNTLFYISALLGIILSGCNKTISDDDFTPGDPPPIAGGYTNSSEVAPDDLIVHFPFDGSIEDIKGTITGGQEQGTVSFTAGRKGEAYQGSTDGFISYDNPGAVAALTSFTVAFWINTPKHGGGAQSVYMLSREGNFWGNFFVLIEGNEGSTNRMQLKLHFEKPEAANPEHWIDPAEKFRPDDMYGAWRHVAYTYDEANSTVTMYVSGNKIALPDDPTGPDNDIVHRTSSGDPGVGPALGPLAFMNATKFVIGAFQNNLGAPYNGRESWMLNYTGKLDELKIFKKALTGQEVAALYKLERQSR